MRVATYMAWPELTTSTSSLVMELDPGLSDPGLSDPHRAPALFLSLGLTHGDGQV